MAKSSDLFKPYWDVIESRPRCDIDLDSDAQIIEALQNLAHHVALSEDPFYSVLQDPYMVEAQLQDFNGELGLVSGRLTYTMKDYLVDVSKMTPMMGVLIPPPFVDIRDMKSDALFILLVENESAYMKMLYHHFYDRFPCIIVTGRGKADIVTRLFLRKLKRVFKLPVFALVDSSHYGLSMLSAYSRGFKDDHNEIMPPMDIKWLGLWLTELDKLMLPAECRLPMTNRDFKLAKSLLEDDYLVKEKPVWGVQLEEMENMGKQAEIDALEYFGMRYLLQVYVPWKLQIVSEGTHLSKR